MPPNCRGRSRCLFPCGSYTSQYAQQLQYAQQSQSAAAQMQAVQMQAAQMQAAQMQAAQLQAAQMQVTLSGKLRSQIVIINCILFSKIYQIYIKIHEMGIRIYQKVSHYAIFFLI